MLSKIILFKSY